jgi:hypothetical protein
VSANTSHSSPSALHRRERRKCSRTPRAQELVDSEMPQKLDSSDAARSYANFRCGTLSVPHRCKFILPQELLAADHL